ncbi:MAG: glycerophosphodiester phosphodiesterase [Spirochaetaceae bacterium]|nr:glycerophosphodiester phosphodiesterase [Spirochaetaceae bacterium]
MKTAITFGIPKLHGRKRKSTTSEILAEFDRPLLFAHRGISSLYPENTMASFRAACDAGIPGIELDVHLTKDGKLVVFHDDTTARIGGSTEAFLRLEETDYAALASLDIGSWKGEEFSGERMPLLDDVLAEFGQRAYFDIEIKSKSTESKGLEPLLAATIRKFGMERRCIVSSFNPYALRWMKHIAPSLPTAIIYCRSKELYWFLRHGEGRWLAPVDILKPEHDLVKGERRFVRQFLGRQSRPVLPWTVDTDAEARRVLDCGVLGVISNRPQDLSAVIS